LFSISCKSKPEKMEENTKEKGDKGEELAAKYLEEHGYQIIQKKWKAGRFEVDIIAENKTHCVFVEVKMRYSNTYGEPWEAVNKAKRKKICASADAYIREKQIEKEPRFDIISILHIKNSVHIQHLEDAFYPLVN